MNLGDLLMIVLSLLLGIAIGYIIRQLLYANKAAKDKEEAGNILKIANEEARNIQLQAKDKALEIRQTADAEISHRRSDLNKEDNRLQRRREELDSRTDRIENREQTLNKRQSTLDKQTNELIS